MKKVWSLLFVLFLFAIFTSSVSAATDETTGNSLDLANLEELQETEGVTVTEVTYEEMIESISENDNISIEEAKEKHPNKTSVSLNRNTFSAFSTNASASSAAPLEINIRQNVDSVYQPSLQIFVWAEGSGSFYWFEGLEHVGMNLQDYNSSMVKQFSGDILAEQTTETKIWWHINGSFYDKGYTTISGSVSANGLVWSGSGSVSYGSNFYAYHNNSGVYSIY